MSSEQDPHFVDIFPPARSFALAVRMSRVRWAPLCLADQESWQIPSVWQIKNLADLLCLADNFFVHT